MKKIFFAFIVLITFAMIAGCSKNDTTSNPPADTTNNNNNNNNQNLPPSAPTGIKCISGDTRISVRWDTLQGLTYNVYYQPGSTVTKTTGIKAENTLPDYVFTNMKNDSVYTFAVSALNQYGESDLSQSVTVSPKSLINGNWAGMTTDSTDTLKFYRFVLDLRESSQAITGSGSVFSFINKKITETKITVTGIYQQPAAVLTFSGYGDITGFAGSIAVSNMNLVGTLTTKNGKLPLVLVKKQ